MREVAGVERKEMHDIVAGGGAPEIIIPCVKYALHSNHRQDR